MAGGLGAPGHPQCPAGPGPKEEGGNLPEVLLQGWSTPTEVSMRTLQLNEAKAFLSQGERVKINILKMFTYCSAGGYISQRWLRRLNAKKPFSDD